MSAYGVRKKRSLEKNELDKMEKEELLSIVFRLQAHNLQLQNIISKQKLPLTDEDKLVIGSREDSTDDEKDGGVETPKCNIKKPKIKKKFDFSKCHKRHIFLKFLYLGWDYQGLVVQEDSSNTIEENLFNALTKACLIEDRQSCNYQRCGRTDKGVSGASQVISLDVRSNISVDKDGAPLEGIEDDDKNELPYCKMLNKLLPHDIRVISWCPVTETYNARYNCTSRSYKYYFIKGQLNIKAMSEASGYLVGEHDFRNLCKMDVGNGVVNFCKNMLEASIERVSSDSLNDDNYDVYVLKITSDGFLWHQIRCIVSVLLTIGQNKEEPSIIKHLLDIEKCPRRPQYTFAHHTPLIFHDCEFDFKPQWRYDSDNSKTLLLQLQKKWTISQIKSTQLRHIIDDVENMTGISMPDVQTSGLLTEPVTHKPFIERQTCESLESRIKHFVKKQRIEKIEEKE